MGKPYKFLGLVLIGAGIVGVVASLMLYHHEPGPPKVSASSTPPSSAKISQKTINSYSVPPTDPKYIAIPAIGIANTPILKLGLLPSGAIATPDNIYETGWYDGSSRPGQLGTMFIYGHVSSWTANGTFYNLKKLVAGNKIIITRGDNKTYTYQVASTKIYPYNKVNMRQMLTPTNPNVPGLSLMTCTGQIIKGANEFNERLAVFASLVKG